MYAKTLPLVKFLATLSNIYAIGCQISKFDIATGEKIKITLVFRLTENFELQSGHDIIFRLNGFEDAKVKDGLIVDEVGFVRSNTGEYAPDERKYMVKKLTLNAPDYFRR